MVTRRRLRLSVGAIALALWCGWPAVASADDCATRAARIAAGQVPATEVDPDCKKAGVLGAAATATVAAATVGIGAVSLGLGRAPAGVASAGGVGGGPGFPARGPGFGGAEAGPVRAGTSSGGGGVGVGPASPGGSTAAGEGRVPVSPSGGSSADRTAHQRSGAVESGRREPPPRPKTRTQPPRAKAVRGAAPALPPTLRGPAAFAALEQAGLAERVSGQEGIYRLRSGVQALGQPGAQGTGVSGVAYFLRADGTLEPNIAVAMVEGGPSSLGSAEAAGVRSASEPASQAPVSHSPKPVSEASPVERSEASVGTSDASAPQRSEAPAARLSVEPSPTHTAEGLAGPGAEAASDLVEEKIRHAVLELFSPGKLVGGRFHDIEHFREQYQEARAIENPWEAQQAQDYVVYRFIKEIGVSEAAARTLLELPKAKWEPLATLIASVAH